jgi:hypothetical protein
MSGNDRQHAGVRIVFGAAAMLLFIVAAGGCTYSVVIVHPPDHFKEPVKTYTVRFHNEYKPGTFEATLSGRDITSLFQPPAAPGGTSTAVFEYPPNFLDRQYDSNRQKLAVSAQFTTPTTGLGNRITGTSNTFSPPYSIVYTGTTGTDKHLVVGEGQTITATAFVERAPKEPLTVTITGDPRMSLNDRPAGDSIQVVIPTNDRRAAFTVRGIVVAQADEFILFRAIADGYASDVSSCKVVAR